jgi:uncharacterized membrane protein (DUF106 family)
MVSLWEWLSGPPGSTIFILCLSVFLAFITTFIRNLLTDKEQQNAWKREIATWKASFDEARRTNNKKLLKKAESQQQQIMKLQSKMSWQSMKTSLLFLGPFLLIWLGITGRILGWQLFMTPFSTEGVTAYLPWFGENPLALNLVWWYIICSIAAGNLFTRIFGLGMEVTE